MYRLSYSLVLPHFFSDLRAQSLEHMTDAGVLSFLLLNALDLNLNDPGAFLLLPVVEWFDIKTDTRLNRCTEFNTRCHM